MRANRGLWTKISRRITELTIPNQRTIWQDHRQKMAEKKDTSATWNVVKSLNGKASTQSRKTLICRGREFCSDKAKASAFCQESATISGRKSDRSSQRANRELRQETNCRRYTPRQEIEREFTINELENVLKRMKPEESEGPDEVAPDLVL